MIHTQSPTRKHNRLPEYNYSNAGAYFITICTKNRTPLLAQIVGDDHNDDTYTPVGDGFPVPQSPYTTQLSPEGEIVHAYIQSILEKYPCASIPHFVIMPDHVHLILTLNPHGTGNPKCGTGNPEYGTGNPSPTVGTIIGWFKYQTTKEINLYYHAPGQHIWQRSYYDHIIRNEKEYQEIAQYIAKNPARWAEKYM